MAKSNAWLSQSLIKVYIPLGIAFFWYHISSYAKVPPDSETKGSVTAIKFQNLEISLNLEVTLFKETHDIFEVT